MSKTVEMLAAIALEMSALTEGVVGHGVLGAHERRDHLGQLHVADLPHGLGDLPDLRVAIQ